MRPAADALVWVPSQAPQAQDYAAQAVDAYIDTSTPWWSFAVAAASRCDHTALRRPGLPPAARELQEEIEDFASTPLRALPS